MKYSPEYLIEKRKEKWNTLPKEKRLDEDRRFREAVANEIIQNKEFRDVVIKYPEYLIELEFVIVDKEQNTVPFFLNEVQKSFIRTLNKAKEDYAAKRILSLKFNVLKGRQQGFTTVITAYQLACALLNKNFSGYTLSDKSDNTEAIFQNKAKFPYDQLPEKLKHTEKYNNKRQLLFEKTNSNWSVDTATKDVGRSKTINFFHGSECAFWNGGMQSIQAGLGEALTKNCIQIYETTANGFNDFQKLWNSGTCINCFYEWWLTPEYRLNFESEEIIEQFINDIEEKVEWIYERLKWLKTKGLELEQLYWYYKKYESYIDKRLIRQEYPCTPEEAFLTSGQCYFNSEKLVKRLQEVKEPIKVGYFLYELHNERIMSYQWIDDPNGFIKIYEDVKERNPYVLGGDTAGEGSDNFTGVVLNNMTGKQVAVLKQKLDEIEYTRQMYCLGMYYNEALIGPETNFSTYPTVKLAEMKYPNIYIRDKNPDDYRNKLETKLGVNTNRATRPHMLAILQTIVKEDIENIVDKETLEEMITFIVNENGKAEAQEGCHDDLVMGTAIAYYIRPQQKYSLLPAKQKTIQDICEPFFKDIDKPNTYQDFGNKIKVI